MTPTPKEIFNQLLEIASKDAAPQRRIGTLSSQAQDLLEDDPEQALAKFSEAARLREVQVALANTEDPITPILEDHDCGEVDLPYKLTRIPGYSKRRKTAPLQPSEIMPRHILHNKPAEIIAANAIRQNYDEIEEKVLDGLGLAEFLDYPNKAALFSELDQSCVENRGEALEKNVAQTATKYSSEAIHKIAFESGKRGWWRVGKKPEFRAWNFISRLVTEIRDDPQKVRILTDTLFPKHHTHEGTMDITTGQLLELKKRE
jgi:hypothetical protein